MSRTFEVELGGQVYTISQLPLTQADAWRQLIEEPLQDIMATVTAAPDIDLTDLEQSVGFVKAVAGVVIHSPRTIRELVFIYSPELKADRERIEAEAYDDEIFGVFVEVLRRTYPFGTLLPGISKLGLMNRPTLPNSSEGNTAFKKRKSAST